jgi:hypothetical protein
MQVMDFLKTKFTEFETMRDKLEKMYLEYFGVKPNGFLDTIPLLVLSTDYSQDNEITGYKSYLKDNFNENMFVNPYTLKIEVILHGKEWKDELEKLVKESRKRNYTIFMYTKFDKIYAPLAITSVSYSENYESYTSMKVSINLKEINLLKFTTTDGKTTTGVYVPETSIQNKETELQIPSDAMSERYSSDTRMGDVMK